MYCTNCGKPNVDVARFCASCGQPILPIQTAPSQLAVPSVSPTFQIPPLPFSVPIPVVVDQSGAGNFRTLSAAVADVAPGTQIRIRPGVYQEHVSITKPL